MQECPLKALNSMLFYVCKYQNITVIYTKLLYNDLIYFYLRNQRII